MAKILLDTSIIIDFLRRKDKEKSSLFSLAAGNNELYASIITHTELYAGKSVWQNKIAKQEIELLFSGIEIIIMDKSISKEAGSIKAHYNTDLLDAIIAATAITQDLKLATLNIKDFQNIEGVKLLKGNLNTN